MRIALDYDHTYTRDPVLWNEFITLAIGLGHDIRGVTARSGSDDRTLNLRNWERRLPVIYCNGVAKESVCAYLEWVPDIWIDDKARSIIHDSPTNGEQLAKWRVERGEGRSYPKETKL